MSLEHGDGFPKHSCKGLEGWGWRVPPLPKFLLWTCESHLSKARSESWRPHCVGGIMGTQSWRISSFPVLCGARGQPSPFLMRLGFPSQHGTFILPFERFLSVWRLPPTSPCGCSPYGFRGVSGLPLVPVASTPSSDKKEETAPGDSRGYG